MLIKIWKRFRRFFLFRKIERMRKKLELQQRLKSYNVIEDPALIDEILTQKYVYILKVNSDGHVYWSRKLLREQSGEVEESWMD